MKIKTWDDLAKAIEQLTPEQRAQEVRYLEGYDARAMLAVTDLLVADANFVPSDGEEEVLAGSVYMG